MYRKKLITLVVCGSLMCSLAACGKTEDVATNTDAETVSEETVKNTITFSDSEFTDTTFTGKVEAINGDEITLSVTTIDGKAVDVSDMPDGQGGDMGGGNGEAPEKPGGDSEGGQGGDMNGDANGEAPEKPDGDSEGGQGGDMNGDADGEAPEKPDGDSEGGQGGDMNGDANGEAPEKPDGDSEGGQGGDMNGGGNGEAPEKPDGDTEGEPGGDMNGGGDTKSDTNGEAPEMPDGETPGEMPDVATSGDAETGNVTVTIIISDESVLYNSDSEAAALSDIEVGAYLAVELDDDMELTSITIKETNTDMAGEMGDPGGGSSGVESYDAVCEYTEDTETTDESYDSTGTDENAIHVYDGATVTLNNATVTRTSDNSTGGDNSSFYGVGAALLVSDGTTYVNGGTFTTDAAGGAGIFSYADGVIYVSDATIRTNQDTSGGIHVAGGGTLYAWNLDVETNGGSAAAIRSDRGSGTMVVDGGTYISNGSGSPAVYCTADITVNDATLTANGSEAVCIEGLNTLRLYDCDLTGNMPDNDQNDCSWNVIVYQSMSGDSEVGNGTFTMSGGSITAKNGGMFYTTNTECTFYLSGVDITYADQNDFFLRCTGNANTRGWGQTGSNGSDCVFTADAQAMEGDIVYDSISNLDFYMINGSTLKGAFVDDEAYAGNGGDGGANVYISSDSVWTVTGDSAIKNLYSDGTIVDESGNTVTIAGSDGTVYVEGSSSYTVTVDNYESTADLSGAVDGGSFSDYEVSR